MDDVVQFAASDCVPVLVGNKVDLRPQDANPTESSKSCSDQDVVTTDEGRAAALRLKALFFETSAKTGASVQELFEKAAVEALRRGVTDSRQRRFMIGQSPVILDPRKVQLGGCRLLRLRRRVPATLRHDVFDQRVIL